MPKVLVVDDEATFRYGVNLYLRKQGIEVVEAETLKEARELLLLENPDIVLLDLNLPDGNGMEFLPEIKRDYPSAVVVVITGRGDIPTAVEAMKLGADHFFEKPITPRDLDSYLFRGQELRELKLSKVAAERIASYREPVFGDSGLMRKVRELALLAAESEAPVLILGETGSGKGVLSRFIHEKSRRRSRAFVEVNCATLRGELLQSELFGHVRGAFTSAVQDRSGLIEIAHGGTLFLDEIGDMSLEVQAQLLKVLEEKQFRRLGDTRVRRSDFRLIAATHRNLKELVAAGKFREDLWFRIQVMEIHLPPLREHREDLPLLIPAILRELGHPGVEVSPQAMALLNEYPFPGNLRELRNLLERALILSRGETLKPEHFPTLAFPSSPPSPSSLPETPASLEELELLAIKKALEKNRGNMEATARELKISRSTLYRKLKKLQGEQGKASE